VRVFFWILGLICYFLAFAVLASSKSAFQEQSGFLVALVGTLFVVGAGIIGSIEKLKASLGKKDSIDVREPTLSVALDHKLD